MKLTEIHAPDTALVKSLSDELITQIADIANGHRLYPTFSRVTDPKTSQVNIEIDVQKMSPQGAKLLDELIEKLIKERNYAALGIHTEVWFGMDATSNPTTIIVSLQDEAD